MARLKALAWLLVFCGAVFGAAGTLAWPGGWLFLISFVGGTFAIMGWLSRSDPALFAERRKGFRQSGQPGWDRWIGLATVVVWFSWLIAMGLGARAHGIHAPVAVLAGGVALIAAGFLLCAASFKANTFATTAVRLQTERDQKVIDRGPYGIVRHPIYSAALLIHLGTLLLLDIAWGVWGLPLLAVLVAGRCVLEERTLRTGLPGYSDYAARVRWRLIPFVW